jgi:RimJ/RimL family protein N-acetyltransferase
VSGRGQPGLDLAGGLCLRAWRPGDAAALLVAQQDPLVRRYSGYLVSDEGEALEAVQRMAATWARGDGAAWALSDGGGTLLGSIRYGLIDARLGLGSVGYWLLPEVRGRGAATAALRATTRVALRDLEWHRVELYHAVENERSCAVARRAGYRPEGVMRAAMRYPVDGRWSDEHLHARLDSDREPLG